MNWEIELHDEVERWFLELCESDPRSADLVEDAIDALARVGPAARMPLVGSIKGSTCHNMKELRPPSSGRSEIRILFVFDPRRCVVLLVAGDKAGDWRGWYSANIPIADQRYASHVARLNEKR